MATNDTPRVMPDELQPSMQSVLATLADIDFAYQHELEQVNSSGVDDVFKSRLVAKLEQLHRDRRQPYADELIKLQNRVRSMVRRELV